MPEDAVIGVLMGATVILIAVETLIGAVFLRAAVRLYNTMAGGASSANSVPEPAFGKAMWIAFAATVVQVVVGLLITGLVIGDRPAATGERELVAQVIFLPVSLLIMASILSARLPTTFGRAFLVTLCDMRLVLLVAGVLAGIALVVLGTR